MAALNAVLSYRVRARSHRRRRRWPLGGGSYRPVSLDVRRRCSRRSREDFLIEMCVSADGPGRRVRLLYKEPAHDRYKEQLRFLDHDIL